MIDIPGLIKGAAEGKGLGNAFLRHVLKAKVFCMVSDCARYESGIQEVIDLLEEIREYIAQKLDNPTITVSNDNNMITILAHKDEELVLEKRMIFVINKYDLINDPDIISEIESKLRTSVEDFFKKQTKKKIITTPLLKKNTFVVSAGTHFGLNDWLNALLPLLKNTDTKDVYHIPEHAIKERLKQEMMITNVSEAEKKFLIENNYLEEAQAKYCEVREIQDPELCKLVRMLPRGNEEAEQRFRKIVEHKGIIQMFEEKGIHKGDVLKIKNYYAGKEDKYIMY